MWILKAFTIKCPCGVVDFGLIARAGSDPLWGNYFDPSMCVGWAISLYRQAVAGVGDITRAVIVNGLVFY